MAFPGLGGVITKIYPRPVSLKVFLPVLLLFSILSKFPFLSSDAQLTDATTALHGWMTSL
jgi:hypothetical protein